MADAKKPRENVLLNLLFSLVLPTLVLTKLSGPHTLGPFWGLIVALAFPIGYGLYDYNRRREANFITAVGFASVLLNGVLGLMHLDGFWFSVKEAAMPSLIAVALLLSLRSKKPLVHQMLYNDQLFAKDRIEAALRERNNLAGLDRLLRRSTWGLALSFFASAAFNFFLARYLLKSPPGTEEFNAELGKLNGWGNAAIMVPMVLVMFLILWRTLKGLEALTGLTQDDLLAAPPTKDKA